MPKLFVYPKKGELFWYPLKERKISIGRADDNDVPLQDPFCSGHHVYIYPANGNYVLRDSGSKNGTFLNGKKVQGEVNLKKGDEILVGSTRIIFDKEVSSNVELTEVVSSARNINTIIHLKEILKKPDIETTIESLGTPDGMKRMSTDLRSLTVLNEVGKALVLHQPLDELLERIMGLISENMPLDRGVLMLKEGNPPQLYPKVSRINNKNLAKQKILVSQSIVNLVMDKHSSVLTKDAQLDPRFMSQDSVIKSNIHSAVCVPLWNNKEIIGVIYADRTSLLDQFTEEDLRLLTLLSNLAAVKIENVKLTEQAIEDEKIKKEIALAAQIQKDFLPRENPCIENFNIAGMNIPCHQVGGDYYDFIAIDDCRWGIVIADVSGKGMGASLLMASLRAALHAELNPRCRLEAMTSKMNDFVHRSTASNAFITFFFGDLNMKENTLSYVNAGHNPPLVLRKNGEVNSLGTCGFCLGMFPGATYELGKMTLNPGDVAVLFTDGITEGRNKKNQEFGEERLITLLKKNAKQDASKIVEKINQEVSAFTSGTPQMDDMTLIVIKRLA